MLDADIVAVSPATVSRVLTAAEVLDRWNGKPSEKGTGFEQPLSPHEHWHIDISYVNIVGSSTTASRFSTGPRASSSIGNSANG
ncbi:MAG TPA: hypothetical protein VF193_05715 [Steroidobacter sp.]|jgi:uncharacterized protein YndB with AHSA1/START domain|nr:hypothetical protein [Stenotrophobium sp.]